LSRLEVCDASFPIKLTWLNFKKNYSSPNSCLIFLSKKLTMSRTPNALCIEVTASSILARNCELLEQLAPLMDSLNSKAWLLYACAFILKCFEDCLQIGDLVPTKRQFH
jgi:hypothetical protein